ncbi:hypothetical protein [Histidinibacterium aquaticum]|uniref:DUF599 family protein n=1 Tax=Histidinibacterium aquaticum TaxID=2613962 RepID=A0A5J5GKA6_9RHOB|nr:hypothetical protein [Histidinibacterium aquaticum]KAA9008756.1 hypothetical protein F3S47_05680 [Histidinibacterium aquaticum]
MPTLYILLDLAAILSSLIAAGLWYQAGARTIRRVSRFETLDHADLNRMVVAMNRSAILNRRAALASAAAAICIALRFAGSLIADATI